MRLVCNTEVFARLFSPNDNTVRDIDLDKIPYISKVSFEIFKSCVSSTPHALSRPKHISMIQTDLDIAKFLKKISIGMTFFVFLSPVYVHFLPQIWSFSKDTFRILTNEPAPLYMDLSTAFSYAWRPMGLLFSMALAVAGVSTFYQLSYSKKITALQIDLKNFTAFLQMYGEQLDSQLTEKIKLLSCNKSLVSNDTLEQYQMARDQLRDATAFFKCG